MQQRRFREEQIIGILQEVEAGATIREVSRARDRGDDVLSMAHEVRRYGREPTPCSPESLLVSRTS